MADTRTCARCGREFEPRREHARFCSARCRVAWNRENLNPDRWGAGNWAQEKQSDPQTQASALAWAVIGMRDTTGRLGRIRPMDSPHAFAVIGEAVWWVTIVDATMVRYHPQVYETALAGQGAAERVRTEGTFGGLRYVRNRMGYYSDHAEFIAPASGPKAGPPESGPPKAGPPKSGPPKSGPEAGPGGGHGEPVTEWTWRSVRKPALGSLSARGRTWEMERYHAYQEWLAGHTIEETFGRAAGFLILAADLAIGPDATRDIGA